MHDGVRRVDVFGGRIEVIRTVGHGLCALTEGRTSWDADEVSLIKQLLRANPADCDLPAGETNAVILQALGLRRGNNSKLTGLQDSGMHTYGLSAYGTLGVTKVGRAVDVLFAKKIVRVREPALPIPPMCMLSARQREILSLRRSRTAEEVARHMRISLATAKSYASVAYSRLGVHTFGQAVLRSHMSATPLFT